MNTQTLVLILFSGLLALFIALFQYVYKSKRSKITWSLVFLRFLSIFCILLLIVNPKFKSVSYFEEKPNLVVAIDDSESISYLKQDEKAKVLFDKLNNNAQLQDKFNIIGAPVINIVDAQTEKELQRWGGQVYDWSIKKFIKKITKQL